MANKKVDKSVIRGVSGSSKRDGEGVPVGSRNIGNINQRVYKDHKMSNEPSRKGTDKHILGDVTMGSRPRSIVKQTGGTARTRK